MTKIVRWLGEILRVQGDKVTSDLNCCCGSGSSGCGCYRIDYTWTTSCEGGGGAPKTYQGNVIFRDEGNDGIAEIVCANDPDATSVEVGSTMIQINYGDFCSITPGINVSLEFRCDGTITMDGGPGAIGIGQIGSPICCGGFTGPWSDDGMNLPENSISILIGKLNDGPCDCTGYDVP